MSIYQSSTNSNSLPVIAGVEITTDTEGRFNLNALHKASGAEKKNGPSYWLALDTTKSLISELEQQLSDTEISVSVIKSVKGGLNQGSYAHELLAVSYAAWISPAFQIQVNKVFIAYRTGNLQLKQPKRDHASKSYLPEFRKAKAMKMTAEALDLCLKHTNLSPEAKQLCTAKALNDISGFDVIPLPVMEEKFYSATEVGEMLGVSANKIGKTAIAHDLKNEGYGKLFLDKSRSSSKQVETFRYNANGIKALRLLIIGEDAA